MVCRALGSLSRTLRGLCSQQRLSGENNIIIILFVRANPKGQIGLLQDFRRLNVALTRARHSVIMVGHADTLQVGQHDVAALLADAATRKAIFAYTEIKGLLYKPEQPKTDSNKKTFTAGQNKSVKPQRVNKQPTIKQPAEKAPQSLPASAASATSSAKTKSCRFFNGKPGSCRKGEQCDFAHTKPQLQAALQLNS